MISNNELIKVRVDFQKKLTPYYEYIQDNYINFYICGSKSLDFIKHPRDINIIMTYNSSYAHKDVVKFREFLRMIHKEFDYDMYIIDEKMPDVFTWLYGRSYINILGSDSLDYNLLEREDKILPLIKYHYKKILSGRSAKRLYDVIYYYYIVNNGSYELTEAQKIKLKEWHAGKYDWDYLKTITDKLGIKWIKPRGGVQ